MSEAVPSDLADRWCDYWRRASGSRAERKALEAGEPSDVQAAHDWVSDKVQQGGVMAVRVLAALAEAAPDGDEGLTVGVGPVEDLLYEHGDEIVDVLVEEARQAPALAMALAHVSLADGTVSTSSLAKLARFRRQGSA